MYFERDFSLALLNFKAKSDLMVSLVKKKFIWFQGTLQKNNPPSLGLCFLINFFLTEFLLSYSAWLI
jgi:hypothetical protein